MGSSKRRRDPIGMGSSKRLRRVDAADRLGDLPDCLLHIIISSLGTRQAIQTTALSRRWRHLWRDVPYMDLDEREFTGGTSDQNWQRFEEFADRALTTISPGTRLDAFRLCLVSVSRGKATVAGKWIRCGLGHLPAAVHIHGAPDCAVYWEPQMLRSSALGSCLGILTRRLTTLRLIDVSILAGFMANLGRLCPVLEDLHVESCRMRTYSIDSLTLRRLAIIGRHCFCYAAPILRAPHLASLHLEIPYHGDLPYDANVVVPEPKQLSKIIRASVRLLDTTVISDEHQWNPDQEKRNLLFLKSMPGLMILLSNVIELHLIGFTTTSLLEEESQDFPMLHNLRSLLLEECDLGMKFQALKGILKNTPKLEKLGFHQCTFVDPATPKRRNKMTSSKHLDSTHCVSWCKNLKLIEMKSRQEDETHMAWVLSKISKGMSPTKWQQVEKSTTIV